MRTVIAWWPVAMVSAAVVALLAYAAHVLFDTIDKYGEDDDY